MTMNAFEKRPYVPTWSSLSLPVSTDNRQPVLHVVASSDQAESRAGIVDEEMLAKINPPVGGGLKRVMDIVVASAALVMAAPVILLVAAILKLSGGRAVFSHSRVGFGGKAFPCYKFRSMVPNAGEVLAAHLAANPDAALEWARTQKLKDDPRVTRFGRMLRKSSLDELPQLFNVLRGEMSCVGPRPIVTEELVRYGDQVGEYLRAKPGLTGLWQVSGRSSTGYDERVALDGHYVRNWSPWLDISILFRTVFAIMRVDRAA